MTKDRTQGDGASRGAARPDPRTGEVPAGPGDAGLDSRPEVNHGTAGRRQMSNRRVGLGLGLAALVALLAIGLAMLV